MREVLNLLEAVGPRATVSVIIWVGFSSVTVSGGRRTGCRQDVGLAGSAVHCLGRRRVAGVDVAGTAHCSTAPVSARVGRPSRGALRNRHLPGIVIGFSQTRHGALRGAPSHSGSRRRRGGSAAGPMCPPLALTRPQLDIDGLAEGCVQVLGR